MPPFYFDYLGAVRFRLIPPNTGHAVVLGSSGSDAVSKLGADSYRQCPITGPIELLRTGAVTPHPWITPATFFAVYMRARRKLVSRYSAEAYELILSRPRLNAKRFLLGSAHSQAGAARSRDGANEFADQRTALRYSQEFLPALQFFFSTKPVHFGAS